MPKGKPRAKKIEPIVSEVSGIHAPDPVNEPMATEGLSLAKHEFRQISDAAEGWLSSAEADLLVKTAYEACEVDCKWAEGGSYAGKSSVLLGGVLAINNSGTLYAIDPHDGDVSEFTHPTNGRLDTNRTHNLGPTAVKFAINVYEKAHLNQFVKMVQDMSTNFVPESKLSLVFIDGLHQYENVLADYTHLKQYLTENAVVIFHDYAWDGPYRVVNDAIAKGELEMVEQAEMLVVLRYRGAK